MPGLEHTFSCENAPAKQQWIMSGFPDTQRLCGGIEALKRRKVLNIVTESTAWAFSNLEKLESGPSLFRQRNQKLEQAPWCIMQTLNPFFWNVASAKVCPGQQPPCVRPCFLSKSITISTFLEVRLGVSNYETSRLDRCRQGATMWGWFVPTSRLCAFPTTIKNFHLYDCRIHF